MWCAPKLDAPQATPRRPLRVSGTIQIRARRPPRGSRRGRQSLGHKKRRGSRGSGGSRLAAGLAALPRQGSHPLPPSDSLLRVLESAVPYNSTPNNPKHSRGECSWPEDLSGKADPKNSKRRKGGCFQVCRAPGSPEILPKSFGRECVPGLGSLEIV